MIYIFVIGKKRGLTMSKESIIKVGRFDKASDYPIGQKLIINGRTCVVTKHGDCADCFLGVPKIQRRDTQMLSVKT